MISLTPRIRCSADSYWCRWGLRCCLLLVSIPTAAGSWTSDQKDALWEDVHGFLQGEWLPPGRWAPFSGPSLPASMSRTHRRSGQTAKNCNGAWKHGGCHLTSPTLQSSSGAAVCSAAPSITPLNDSSNLAFSRSHLRTLVFKTWQQKRWTQIRIYLESKQRTLG